MVDFGPYGSSAVREGTADEPRPKQEYYFHQFQVRVVLYFLFFREILDVFYLQCISLVHYSLFLVVGRPLMMFHEKNSEAIYWCTSFLHVVSCYCTLQLLDIAAPC